MHYLILGTLYNDDAVINQDGEVITPATPMQGYHLNTSAKLDGLDVYLTYPSKPRNQLNTEKQFFYTFTDEAEFNSLCMIPVYETQQESYTYYEQDEDGNNTGNELSGVRNVQVDTGEIEFNTSLFIQNVTVPQEVTMRQARLELLNRGLLDSVNATLATLNNAQAQIEWDYSNEVQRDNELINALSSALGLSQDDIDSLFIEAAKL